MQTRSRSLGNKHSRNLVENNENALSIFVHKVGNRLDSGQIVRGYRNARMQLECGVPSTVGDPAEMG